MSNPIRIGVAGIYHETNSFAPGITEVEHFRDQWVEDAITFDKKYRGTRTSMGGTIDAAESNQAELVCGFVTYATPSGMVSAAAAEELMDHLIATLPTEVDGYVLFLHGAMVAENHDDMEDEIVRRIREKAGPDLPIAVTLDLHANISQSLANRSDIIVGYDTYPHVDMYERAVEATDLLCATIRGEIRPYTAWKHARMLVVPQTMITSHNPMKALLETAWRMEKLDGVLAVTVAGGFPYSDIPDAGMSFTVTTDGDEQLAERCLDELTQLAWSIREQFQFPEVTVEEAARWTREQTEGPIIWIEGSDNVGGGSPADATHVLRFLVQWNERSLIVIRDEEAARKAHELGVGAELSMAIGGKSDELHGDPVAVTGKIRLLSDGRFTHQGSYMTGKEEYMGKTAVLELEHMTILITEKRVPPFDVGHVRSAGIRPETYKVIVAKSAVAWRTSFGDIAKGEIFIDTPGCCSANLSHFQYKKIKRPIYPLEG
ncbi:M81 family metallopeptidase [Paenibacillus senegalensis]|uniref:M81 family metallopeptidase n=1 Tax=Paenibacillus senegalensis TaxID=1465766 RepID=UPI000288B68B|nr:M81 family metallopeptidase [Paenibacillus senegalensis]